MRARLKNLLLVVLAMLVGFYFNVSELYADNKSTSSISVSPTYQNIILIPGEKYYSAIEVRNGSDERDLYYHLSTAPFSQKANNGSRDDYGAIDMSTISNYSMIKDWIVFDSEDGVIAPNERETVNFVIDVPNDAPAGGQYASILVTDRTNELDPSSDGVGVQSILQFASILYAEVTGETRNTGAILENDLPSFITSNVLEATSMIENTGNVHTRAEYILQVWPLFSDEEICTNEEELSSELVLPETRKYHSEKCQLPIVGVFRAKQTVKIFGEASVTEKTIIVCPLWLLFLVVFGVIAVVIYFVMRVKLRKSRRN